MHGLRVFRRVSSNTCTINTYDPSFFDDYAYDCADEHCTISHAIGHLRLR